MRENLKGGYLNFDEAEFSLFVERVANVGQRRSRKAVVNHWAKKVLQVGGAWGNHAKSSNSFLLDELLNGLSKVFSKGECLARGSRNLGILGKQFGEERGCVHLQDQCKAGM